jgi:hypothetical protein
MDSALSLRTYLQVTHPVLLLGPPFLVLFTRSAGALFLTIISCVKCPGIPVSVALAQQESALLKIYIEGI